jgi:hypothetical protein
MPTTSFPFPFPYSYLTGLEAHSQLFYNVKPNPTIPSAKVHKIIHKPDVKMTIILWTDKTKTIAKVGHDDIYNEEHGVAMCVLKKIFGSYSKYEKFIEGK